MVKTSTNKGYVVQIIGPVLDIEFPSGNLPPIYSAIKIETADGLGNIVEVQQLLGDNKIRAVSMRSTDGLKRGVEAVDLGAPISVPVGATTLGRIFNVVGEPVDEQGDVSTELTSIFMKRKKYDFLYEHDKMILERGTFKKRKL